MFLGQRKVKNVLQVALTSQPDVIRGRLERRRGRPRRHRRADACPRPPTVRSAVPSASALARCTASARGADEPPPATRQPARRRLTIRPGATTPRTTPSQTSPTTLPTRSSHGSGRPLRALRTLRGRPVDSTAPRDKRSTTWRRCRSRPRRARASREHSSRSRQGPRSATLLTDDVSNRSLRRRPRPATTTGRVDRAGRLMTPSAVKRSMTGVESRERRFWQPGYLDR